MVIKPRINLHMKYERKLQLGRDIYNFWVQGKFDIEKYTTLDGVRP